MRSPSRRVDEEASAQSELPSSCCYNSRFSPARARTIVTAPAETSAEAPSSVRTRNLPALLQQLKSSLLVSTTDQQRMLIVVRSDGERLHTDFVALKRPMGIAADSRRSL